MPGNLQHVALAMLIAGSLPAGASAQTVPLTIKITEVQDLSDFPGFDLTTDPDFFVIASANGVTPQSNIVDDNGHFFPGGDGDKDPSADTFTFTFQIPRTQRSVPVNLTLKDHDPDPEADALADIAPLENASTLDFTVNMGTGCAAGDVQGSAGATICSQGEAGSSAARLCFTIQIGSSVDSDGDGLKDAWEAYGMDANHDCTIDIDEDLPASGADPGKKDIFVWVDWMDCAVAGGDCPAGDKHSHRLDERARAAVVAAFAAHGINLHVAYHRSLVHQWFVYIPGANCVNNPAPCDVSFDTIKAGAFAGTDLRLLYHYMLFGHQQDPSTGSSGCAEPLGNDVLVTLGTFDGKVGTVQQQAGTFMHELGHNLGLQHGGFEGLNFKPNYVSIMNYWYQMGGLQPTDPDGAGPLSGQLDYSSGKLSSLSETSLDETRSLGTTTAAITFFCPNSFSCESPKATAVTRTVTPATASAGPIPWQCEAEGFTPQTVKADLHGGWSDKLKVCYGPLSLPLTGTACTTDADCGGAAGPTCSITAPSGGKGCNTSGNDNCHNPGEAAAFCGPASGAGCDAGLNDYDDWGHLQLAFQSSPTAADGVHTGGEVELDADTFQRVLAADLAVTADASPKPVLTGRNVTFSATAANIGPSGAESVTLGQSLPPQVTFVSCAATGSVSCGGTATAPVASWPSIGAAASQRIDVVASVRCDVPDGTVLSSTARAESANQDRDLANNQAVATVVASNPPPVISNVSISVDTLWTPDHRMVRETVRYTVTDNCGTPACHLEVASNEPINGLGDGDMSPDWLIGDATHLQLRAERSGTGTGRVYTVSVVCSDSGGGASRANVLVRVPRDQR